MRCGKIESPRNSPATSPRPRARINMNPRLREIPYNYTSFSDREIVIRLLGARGLGACSRSCASERRTGRSARMLYEVLGDIWVVQRNPYLQDDLLDNPRRRSMLVEALHHRLGEIEKRRTPTADAARDASSASCSMRRAQRRRRPSQPSSRDVCGPAQARRAQALAQVTRQGQHRVRRPVARLARHRRHRLARRVSVRRADARHRGRDAPRSSRGCIELGLTIIPRGGGTGYTGGAMPLTPGQRGHQHREARGDDARSSTSSLPGHRRSPCHRIGCGAGVVTQRVMEAAEARAACSRSTRPRPTPRASAATSR